MNHSLVGYDSRDNWLAARRTSIGSSDAPTLWGCGYSGTSVFSLWAEKAHGVHRSFSKSMERKMGVGSKMEVVLRELFEEETGLKVEVDPPFSARVNVTVPYLSASLDSHTTTNTGIWCPVELKNVTAHNAYEWDDGQCPLKYQVQVCHQAIVVGAPGGYVFGLIGGHDPQVRWVDLTDDFREAHLELCARFWELVESKTAPSVDSSEGTTEALSMLFPKSIGERIETGDWLDQVSEEIEALEEQRKKIETDIEERKNRIRATIGDAEGCVSPRGTTWTWKVQETAGYTVAPKIGRVLRRATVKKRKGSKA